MSWPAPCLCSAWGCPSCCRLFCFFVCCQDLALRLELLVTPEEDEQLPQAWGPSLSQGG